MGFDSSSRVESANQLSQSGSRIEIYQSTSLGFPGIVRKYRGAVPETRFLHQIEEFRRWSGEGYFGLYVPSYLRSENQEWFETEYFAGTSLGHAIGALTASNWSHVEEQLCETLHDALEQNFSTSQIVAADDYFEYVASRLDRSPWLTVTMDLPYLVKLLEPIRSLSFPVGEFHGDFSMDNILVNSGGSEVAVIDFSESPVESVCLDIARLWLDAKYGWWAQNEAQRLHTRTRTRAFAKELESVFRFFYGAEAVTNLRVLAIAALVRIAPYSKVASRKKWIENALRNLATDEEEER